MNDFLWDLVSKNCDELNNQKMKIIHHQVNKKLEWGKMDNEDDDATSLWWTATDGGFHGWVTIKLSRIIKDQIVGIYLGYDHREDVEACEGMEYAITNNNVKKSWYS